MRRPDRALRAARASLHHRPRRAARRLAPWLAALAVVGALGCEAAGGRAIGDSCAEDAECESGVCWQNVCLSATLDEDDDGLPNRIEARLATDPQKSDTDDDGWDDLVEVRDTQAPADSDGDGVIDALESALLDADDDCLVDQIDPENDVQSAAARSLLDKTCRLGVCGQPPLADEIAVGCEDGRLVCRRGTLGAPFVAEEGAVDGCGDTLDNDCDGETDEGTVDSDDDEQPDCVDDDDDDDGTLDADDCLPLDPRCAADCTDSDDDGEPDCLSLCPADPAQVPVVCDDGVACTTDGCEDETGCVHAPDDAACDDGNPCTDDVCDPLGGCRNDPNGAACDDGEPCTQGDVCVEDACVPGEDVCACRVTADCAAEEDGDLCNGTLRCDTSAVPYACIVDVGTVVTCGTTGDTTCAHNECQPATGACEIVPFNEGGACDDGNPCTSDDACAAGQCVGESQCACTTDADCADLDDGDLCNGVFRCNKTSLPFRCEGPVAPVTCPTSEDTDCVTSQCVPATGACELLPANEGGACEDGLVCTGDGACAEGVCTPGGARDCDDGVACTADSCQEEGGTGCLHAPDHSLCEDDDPCTADVCDVDDGCTFPPDDTGLCDDGDDCTTDDRCSGGACIGTPVCECQGGSQDCLPFEDGDLCNGTYTCDQATFPWSCVIDPATVVTCDDSQDTQCLVNTCNTATGVCGMRSANEDDACDDGDPCTPNSFCQDGECVGAASNCDCRIDADCVVSEDGDLCNGTLYCDTAAAPYRCRVDLATIVTCDTTGDTDCSHTVCVAETGECVTAGRNEGGSCSDGDACTSGDTCQGGACVAGPATDCDDDDGCTIDSCVSSTGCTHTDAADDSPCEDGDPCTAGDRCVAGACVAGGQASCDDRNACTTDVCTPGVGCEHTNVLEDTPCEDGNLCTTGDTCHSGICITGTGAPACDDRVDCTIEGCDPDVGCTHTPDPTRCNDQLACTENVCDPDAGCVFVPDHTACADDLTCTVDTCVRPQGCVHTPDASLCADGVACTSDVCDPVEDCQNVPSPGACDDGVGCTADSCDPLADCQHVPDVGLCPEDGNPCTESQCDLVLGCTHADSGSCVCQSLGFSLGEAVRAGDTTALSGGPGRSVTVEAWVSIPTLLGVQSIVSKSLPGGAGGEWALLAVGNSLVFRFWPDGGSTPYDVTAEGVLAAGIWTHVAAVLDRSPTSPGVRLFVDGGLVGSQGLMFDTGDTAAPVYVGPNPDAGWPFEGNVDEVRIWSLARSQASILAALGLAVAGGAEGLVARWAFDDVGTVTTVDAGAGDFSGHGHPLTFSPGALPTPGPSAPLAGCL